MVQEMALMMAVWLASLRVDELDKMWVFERVYQMAVLTGLYWVIS